MEKEDRTRACEADNGSRGVTRTDRSKTDGQREEARRTLGVDDMGCVVHCTTSYSGPGLVGFAGCLGQEKRRSEGRPGAAVVAAIPSAPDTKTPAARQFTITGLADIVEAKSLEQLYVRVGYAMA